MCGGAEYVTPNPETKRLETRRVYFPQPHAHLPVIGDGGEIELVQWGRRNEQEDPESDAPVTGWAREDKLQSGFWKRFEPETVLIPVVRFAEKGKLPKSRWFDMPPETYLMGLRIHRLEKDFLYVVTDPAVGELAAVHDRMPLVVSADFHPAAFDTASQAEPEPQISQQKLF